MDKFSAQVENMEGAGFFYVMMQSGIPFLELRAVSNFIEPRDVEKWEIMYAINNLNQVSHLMIHLEHCFSSHSEVVTVT
jgi:futalosine hydrolase